MDKTAHEQDIVPQAFERLASLQTRWLLKQSRATGQQLVEAATCGSKDLHLEGLLRDLYMISKL